MMKHLAFVAVALSTLAGPVLGSSTAGREDRADVGRGEENRCCG